MMTPSARPTVSAPLSPPVSVRPMTTPRRANPLAPPASRPVSSSPTRAAPAPAQPFYAEEPPIRPQPFGFTQAQYDYLNGVGYTDADIDARTDRPPPSAAASIRPASAPTSTPRPDEPYDKNGHRVVDTQRKDAAGHVPTHRLDQETNRRPGQSWQDYEDAVIARQSFSPDTAARSGLASLEKPVADSARAMLTEARLAGVKLGVNETRRTQERQEMLFQKGRRPGSGSDGVVTWTLTSDHTPGRAIDFSGSPQAFGWLQKNAPRFGFVVMGAMDPGHVSMP